MGRDVLFPLCRLARNTINLALVQIQIRIAMDILVLKALAHWMWKVKSVA